MERDETTDIVMTALASQPLHNPVNPAVRQLAKDIEFAIDVTEPREVLLARFEQIIEQALVPMRHALLAVLHQMEDGEASDILAGEITRPGAVRDLCWCRDQIKGLLKALSRHLEEPYGPFTEQGELYGIPISVGGKKASVNVNLQDGDLVHYCEASRDTALKIAPLLFYQPIRVFGIGRYYRDVDGQWHMNSFRIADFEKLDPRPLSEVVERLRSITRNTGLDRDIVHKLAELRE